MPSGGTLLLPDLAKPIKIMEGATALDVRFRIDNGTPETVGVGPFIALTNLPSGLSLISLVDPSGFYTGILMGSMPDGIIGEWPVAVRGQKNSVYYYFTLKLRILPSWIPDPDAISSTLFDPLSDDEIALGDFYYGMMGGPLRKEFS